MVIWISIITIPNASAKGIFKCVKPDGEVEYTQSPSKNCQAQQQMKNRGGKADQEAIDELYQDKKRTNIAAGKDREKLLAQQDAERTERELQEYCNSVRENLEQITTANRVFETDDHGNRTRLDEEQRQQRIQENNDSLAVHCN